MIDDADDEEAVAPPPQFDNAADEKRIRQMRDRAKREVAEATVFWRAVFADPVGRREMWQLLAMGHPFDEYIATADKHREATWILAGERRLAMRLYRMWQRIDLDGVARMHCEHDPELNDHSQSS